MLPQSTAERGSSAGAEVSRDLNLFSCVFPWPYSFVYVPYVRCCRRAVNVVLFLVILTLFGYQTEYIPETTIFLLEFSATAELPQACWISAPPTPRDENINSVMLPREK